VHLFRRAKNAADDWIFADEVLSAVTEDECRRLAALARSRLVLEIGSYYGRSTIALASTAAVVHSVDPHDGGPVDSTGTLPAFLDGLERYSLREKVVVHVGRSTQILPLLRDQSFDLVFVDAMHQRPEVDVDLFLSACCLRAGGRLALHDYGRDGVQVGDVWHPFGVTEAVDEFVARTGVAPPEVVDTLAVLSAPERATPAWDAWSSGVRSLSPVPS
jgi:SAM-dependent methyltransferase